MKQKYFRDERLQYDLKGKKWSQWDDRELDEGWDTLLIFMVSLAVIAICCPIGSVLYAWLRYK